MTRSTAVDTFSLAYIDTLPSGTSTTVPADVVLLHGWPGDASDYRDVSPLLADKHRLVIPDLRGFGESDRWAVDPDRYYSPSAQASSVASLITELGLHRPVVAGYDIGSRIAQTLAKEHPDLVGALALSPPLPGAGARVVAQESVPELWYQYFHRSPLSVPMLDGHRDAVHAYLKHFWSHWSGPNFEVMTPDFEALVDRYSRHGAFQATTNWYRVGGGYVGNALTEKAPDKSARIQIPTHVLWQELDPLFPRAWSDRLDEFFADVTLHWVDGVGHFTPLEAPEAFARLIETAIADVGVNKN